MNPRTASVREEILQQALSLDATDRAILADELERSLPTSAFVSGEIASAWSNEIDRRIAAYERGQTTAVDFDSALSRVRQALAAHRNRQRIS